jgi:hypothetical protein
MQVGIGMRELLSSLEKEDRCLQNMKVGATSDGTGVGDIFPRDCREY